MADTSDDFPPSVAWRNGRVRLIDQRKLPGRLEFIECRTVPQLCAAIENLTVRGAPALGATGAFGVAMAAQHELRASGVRAAAEQIKRTRPTAVNLAVCVDAAFAAYEQGGAAGALACAEALAVADVAINRAIGSHGMSLLHDGANVLTHCNAGALACVGFGTAIGVIRAAHEAGRRLHVWVDETRPVLQGARLTAWELTHLGVPCTLVPDNSAASLMARGEVDVVIVGADRIAANGDVANKIGTYGLAVLARHHKVPFVVAAPTSTIDLGVASGEEIPIETRDPDEVTQLAGVRIAPEGMAALNLAFDVSPASLVSAIVTEVGVAHAPYRRSLASHVRRAAAAPPA